MFCQKSHQDPDSKIRHLSNYAHQEIGNWCKETGNYTTPLPFEITGGFCSILCISRLVPLAYQGAVSSETQYFSVKAPDEHLLMFKMLPNIPTPQHLYRQCISPSLHTNKNRIRVFTVLVSTNCIY